jgi:hypothetical protein
VNGFDKLSPNGVNTSPCRINKCMPLSWNEIRNRAHEFSKRWEGESSERAEAQSFWNEFNRSHAPRGNAARDALRPLT